MSKDNVKQMFAKMAKDAEFQKRYADLMQAHQKETEKALADKLIGLGKTVGFTFSTEDLLAARSEVMDKNNSNKELSDDDLSNVAGGGAKKSVAVMASIFSLGIACAVNSINAEKQQAGGCGALMSTTAKC